MQRACRLDRLKNADHPAGIDARVRQALHQIGDGRGGEAERAVAHALRHVDALIEGDITDLTSNNFDDVERLRQLLEGKSVGPVRAKGVAA